MGLKENINVKKNPVTTIAGSIFLTISAIMVTAPMFIDVKKDFTGDNWYILLGTFIAGALLVIAPDKLPNMISSVVGKFFKTKEEGK